MPIIFLKNPRSGSHFRFIGGGNKGGRPMRGARKHRMLRMEKRIRSVGWASCNTAFQNAVRWGKGGGSFAATIHPVKWTFWQILANSGPTATIEGYEDRRPTTGADFADFGKPCR